MQSAPGLSTRFVVALACLLVVVVLLFLVLVLVVVVVVVVVDVVVVGVAFPDLVLFAWIVVRSLFLGVVH